MVVGLPDLEKGLCRIQYGSVCASSIDCHKLASNFIQCTPKELCTILDALHNIANTFAEFRTREDVVCHSKLLKDIMFTLPKLQQPVRELASQIKPGAAKIGEKHRMWEPTSVYYEELQDCEDVRYFISC